MSVANGIQFFQRGNTFREHAVATLRIDIFRRVARKRGDDLDFMRARYSGSHAKDAVSMIVRLFRSMTCQPTLRARFDEISKMLAQFRSAPGDVHDRRPMFTNPGANPPRDHFIHHFGAPRRGVHMAMRASLIAFASHVDLQRLKLARRKFSRWPASLVSKRFMFPKVRTLASPGYSKILTGIASRLPSCPSQNFAKLRVFRFEGIKS